ncbi:MAG: radical SAM protein [Promethearchaeota archaeon]
MIDDNTVFEKKTELLCKGLYLDKKLLSVYNNQGIEIDFGRKGGAGPLGGRYFLFENGTLVNAALWGEREKTNLFLKSYDDGFFNIYNIEKNEPFHKLKLVSNPRFYHPNFKTSDGIPMKKIALVHGLDCLSSTIYQKCIYWACGEACKFCGIELSLQSNSTIEEKTAKQMCEVIEVAKNEGRCNHMTLTSGTDKSDDKGAKRYVEMLKGIKQKFPNLPLHVQIEPLENLVFLDELRSAGADTIGIHIELLDENLRRIVTPGKYHISYELFEKNWQYALELFGKNQVETFILTGFEESFEQQLSNLEKVISLGVIPFITPVRSIPGKKDLPMNDPKRLIKLYKSAAHLMKKYEVNPLKNKAGCVKCGGCSAINEAYKII